ncbi:hypothetical protein [Algoriphagus yeomjeoni]|uniref:Uncharacterized protein n=1 Tax=Algoriphagus yeomjeoni TaxID=291403 RepID=A0A327PS61_9BACT|nr:hypothetical protein [Algoriphagus yeomjeoni]RAI94919.1 hypothetical protein LV83_00166 [Algoriphagus yeomjeoni]
MKKPPFLYRSFFNFWLVYILPASILTIILTQLFKGSISWNFFKLPSTYVKMLIFQVIFGLWMYYRDYKPKSKQFKDGV